MAFDLSTAKPVKSGGFDLSTAKPIDDTPRQKPTTGLDALDYFGEGTLAIGANIANEAYAGLRGIANLPQGLDAATAAIRDQQQNPIYTPKTEQGQKFVGRAGELADVATQAVRYPMSGLAGLGDLATGNGINQAANTVQEVQDRGYGQVMADRTFDATGSPAAATAALIAPDVAGVVAGGRAINAAKIPRRQLIDDGEITPKFRKALQKRDIMSGNLNVKDIQKLPDTTPKKATTALIESQLRERASDNHLAPYKLDERSKMGPDDLAMEAERQGMPRGDIMAVKSGTAPTLHGMLRMLKMHRAIKGNSSLATQDRPTDITGKSAMKRFDFIRKQINKDRNELNRIVKTQLGGKMVDSARVQQVFYDGLRELKVGFNESLGPKSMKFEGSQIVKNPSAQRMIRDVADILMEPRRATAERAHDIKRQLDDLIDFNKKSKDGLSESGRRFAKAIRHELNQMIRDVDEGYGQVNDRLHAGIDAIKSFDKSMGGSIDVFDENAFTVVGSNLRKLLSNYAVRGNIDNAIMSLDDVARQFGGKFDDDIPSLVNFAAILDSRFGEVGARNSFQSKVGAGTKEALRDVASGNYKQATINKIAEVAGDKIDEMRGLNDDNAYRSIEALIMRELSNPTPSQGTR